MRKWMCLFVVLGASSLGSWAQMNPYDITIDYSGITTETIDGEVFATIPWEATQVYPSPGPTQIRFLVRGINPETGKWENVGGFKAVADFLPVPQQVEPGGEAEFCENLSEACGGACMGEYCHESRWCADHNLCIVAGGPCFDEDLGGGGECICTAEPSVCPPGSGSIGLSSRLDWCPPNLVSCQAVTVQAHGPGGP